MNSERKYNQCFEFRYCDKALGMWILMHGLPGPKLVVLLDLGLTGPQQSVLSQLIYAKDKYTYILQ